MKIGTTAQLSILVLVSWLAHPLNRSKRLDIVETGVQMLIEAADRER